ncbi:subtilisin-like serine protease [Medicago truncatula]|uniref:Subtilisin-like serine protease n=1 Tax=Medicago truncatula TaxID=3880 RepID=G7J9B7_MEDTR|nr:subtilisin-like serine protease [Medicago truncatula]
MSCLRVYRSSRCDTANILSAFDDSIACGIDILSVLIGGEVGNHHILTIFATGNKGPQPVSLDNFSAWSIVVGVVAIDRNPDGKLINGKIVMCGCGRGSQEAFRVGVIGVLTQGKTSRDTASPFPLPGCYFKQRLPLKYINIYTLQGIKTSSATIFKKNELENTLAPMVASFSLRGRSIVTPDILKFNIMSGISMACPHVSGATRYIKSFQPKWSHTAIRYAFMILNLGLIYDASCDRDCIMFLCGQGYNKIILQLISGDDINYSKTANTTTMD